MRCKHTITGGTEPTQHLENLRWFSIYRADLSAYSRLNQVVSR